jgi:hypothetical protein
MMARLQISGLPAFCLIILTFFSVGCESDNASRALQAPTQPFPAAPAIIEQPAASPAPYSTAELPTIPKVNAENPVTDRLAECGTVSFVKNGRETKLPLRCVQAEYGVDDPNNPTTIAPKQPLPSIPYTIPAGSRAQLAVYWMNLGNNVNGVTVLAPKGWKVAHAGVGANGSSSLRLEDPDDERQYIDHWDNGACQGCLIGNIGSYFPELRQWAEDLGFPSGPIPFKRNVLLNPNHMGYSLNASKAGYELHGVAFQQHDEHSGLFRDQEVQLRSRNRGTATTMLNLFVTLNAVEEQ